MIRKYTEADIPAMVEIWNEVVSDGIAFPQEEELDETTSRDFSRRRPTARLRRMTTAGL